MAPKRRGRKVVSSVVKTKVVKETLQVATTILPDSDTQPEPEVVDVHGSTAVRVVEVTTPDGEAPAAKKPKKSGQGQDDASPKSPEPPVVVPVSAQSQETQEDPSGNQDQPEQKATGKPEQGEKKKKPAPEAPETPTQKKPKSGSRRSTALKEGSKQGRRRRGSAPEMGYKTFVYRVLKQVHPDLGASGKTMEILDMMMADMFERLAEEAARLTKHAGRSTLTSREVQSAVRLVLPGELAVHAISEGTKAVTNYMSRSRD